MKPRDFSEPIDRLMLLGNAQIIGNDKAIDNLEKTGQRDFNRLSILPVRSETAWETLTRWGVQNVGPNEDKLFYDVILPEGWKKEASEDSAYYSYLLDDRGLRRAQIFYKASFWDRDAFISPNHRFYCGQDYATRESDDTIYSAPAVIDRGRDVIVAKFSVVQLAYQNGVAGVVMGDNFYFEPQPNEKDVIIFTRNCEINDPSAITEKESRKDKGFYMVRHAIDSLIYEPGKAFLSQFPDDDTIWLPQYDLPAI